MSDSDTGQASGDGGHNGRAYPEASAVLRRGLRLGLAASSCSFCFAARRSAIASDSACRRSWTGSEPRLAMREDLRDRRGLKVSSAARVAWRSLALAARRAWRASASARWRAAKASGSALARAPGRRRGVEALR